MSIYRSRLIHMLLVFVISILFFQVGFGQELIDSGMVTIKADTLYYDKQDLYAIGHVVLTAGDTKILCNELVYNPVTGLLESRGGEVIFERLGEKTIGSKIVYNLLKSKGSLTMVSGKTRNIYLEGEPIRGELFYNAKSIEIDHNVITLKNGEASTCDFPEGHKHYHITAEEVKIFPGDKMVIYHGRIWIGKTPLWHVAKMVIDLHPHPGKRQSYVPSFGYNKTDGFFIKTTTNYLAYANNYGNLLFDYYQKTGFAAGIDHEFPIASHGSGHISVYEQHGRGFQNFTREQLSTGLQYEFEKGFTANANVQVSRFRVPPIISPDNYSSQASLTKQGERYIWTLMESNNSTAGFSNSQTVQFHEAQDLTNTLHYDFQESFYKSTIGRITDSTFHNLTSITKRFDGWATDFFYEKTDSGLFQGGFINRTPEIVLRTDNLSLKPYNVPYQLSMGFANFEESFQTFQTERFDFQANLPQHTFELTPHLHLTSAALFRQDFYDTGNYYLDRNFQARYILGDQTQLSTTLANHFDAVLDYRSQSDTGFDPLVYDIVQPYRSLGGEFSVYNKDFWKLNIGTSYDFKNNFYQQLTTRIDLHPRSNWFFHFDAYYDPNFKQWQSLISQADFWPMKDIRIQYWSSLSFPTGQIGYQDIAISKEWHDWEARFQYRWHQQEIFFFFNLKAFPEQQVQLGINPVLNADPNANQFEIR